MCDGDVVRLGGVHFCDRSVAYFPDLTGNFRATFATWGAEHNAYNTEWHTQDAYDLNDHNPGTQTCPGQTKLFTTIGTSDKQKTLGLYFAEAVIRARSKASIYGQLLNPAYDLPSALTSITRIDRGYFPGTPIGGGLRLVRFDSLKSGDCATKLFTTTNAVSSCGGPPEHQFEALDKSDPTNTWIARVRWGPPAKPDTQGAFAKFIVNGGHAADLSHFKTIEFRIGPDCSLTTPATPDLACKARSAQDHAQDGSQNVDFTLQDQSGHFSDYVFSGTYTQARAAIGLNESPQNGGSPINPLYHAIMSSVRIPVADFGKPAGFDIGHVKAIWVWLNPGYNTAFPTHGALLFGDVWATTAAATAVQSAPASVASRPTVLPKGRMIGGTDALIAIAAAAPAAAEGAEAEAGVQADPGNAIVQAVRKSAPVAADAVQTTAAQAGSSVIEVTFATKSHDGRERQRVLDRLGWTGGQGGAQRARFRCEPDDANCGGCRRGQSC
jgi:hypothetical protein